MSDFPRLPPRQIGVIKHLMLHCGIGGQVILTRAQRTQAVPLWRRGLVDVWHRMSPVDSPRPHGPFFSLTMAGKRLGYAILCRERGVGA